jgi:tyrosine-protein phosphatase SIW14
MRHYSGILVLSLALAPLSVRAADAPGVPNFHAVNDHVYRGGQPSRDGIDSLARIGVRTVVDLRGGRALEEEKLVQAAGMRYVHVPMDAFAAPSDQEITTLLDLLDDESASPVFIHCKRGSDRTGTVIACYRMKHDRWDNRKALAEARVHGMAWIERAMQQYILNFEPAATPATSQSTARSVPASQ